MKKANTIIAILLCISIAGCSAFQPYTQPVSFKCDPPDVMLVINGKKHDCPITLDMQRNKEMFIEGYKDGHAPYKRTVSYHNSATFYLDLIGTCTFLLPVVGLMTPGARDLDETDINVILTKN